MNPILEQFLIEARENILFLDKNLSSLDSNDSEIINALFRAAHTLKGSSGLAGFNSVKDITHIAEDLLDAYRNSKIEFSKELLDALYDMFDEVTELIDTAEESGEIIVVDSEIIEKFELLRLSILDLEAQSDECFSSEFNIIDKEEFKYSNYFKNDFENINIDKLNFEVTPITVDSFSEMNYYIIDLDLSQDILEFANDPFYSIYLLGNENIVSIYTEVIESFEDMIKNPIVWRTRVVLIVESSQELLEDAFYNFMEDVTITPLSIKSLFSATLKPQSNDSIIDFINDLKSIIESGSFDSLDRRLESILKVLNPNSLQGFLFHRLDYFIKKFEVSNSIKARVLEFILNEIGVGYTIESSQLDSFESTIEESKVDGSAAKLQSDKSDNSIEPNSNNFDIDIEDKEVKSLLDILQQQKSIINESKDENSIPQLKLILSRLESSLDINLNLDSLSSTDSLEYLINDLISKIKSKYSNLLETKSTTTDEDNKVSNSSKPIKSIKSSENKDKKINKQIAKTVKVDLEDIDSMMDIVGEMLVIKNSLPYIADAMSVDTIELNKRDLIARYDEINRVTTLLQEKVMQMRLLSLSFIFDRYPKLIRDISKSLDKKINYNESGGDTKLDKTVIEKLADPLIHIIRNSLDHGIEKPEDRLEKGKSAEGNISIKAESLGDKVYVTIEDDGKGIDVEKVVHKAIEKGMVDIDNLDNMSHEEKLLLVFNAGVSTMEQISELSGRGVGMDVVRQTIDEVGGKISIHSTIDIGTKIVLELPMSVALTNVFHIKLGKVNYALSMDTISETVQVDANEVEYINNKPMLKLRGSLIPLIFNYNLLSKGIKDSNTYSLLIIETQGHKFGFVVDKFVNQLDIVQKPLSTNLKNHPFISGTSLLGNGEVLFVINPSKLINLKEKK